MSETDKKQKLGLARLTAACLSDMTRPRSFFGRYRVRIAPVPSYGYLARETGALSMVGEGHADSDVNFGAINAGRGF
jgi:hypothetical protein